MKRPCAACRYVCGSLAAVTAVTSALPMTVMANTLSANFDMRRQVVNLTGILNVSDYTGQVTRGDFARMLVNASSYRETCPHPAYPCSRMCQAPIRMPSISA